MRCAVRIVPRGDVEQPWPPQILSSRGPLLDLNHCASCFCMRFASSRACAAPAPWDTLECRPLGADGATATGYGLP